MSSNIVSMAFGLDGLQQMFSVILYGAIGLIAPSVIWWSSLDAFHDRMKAMYVDRQDTFDFIVVGAGSSGAALANRLSEDFRVLLLEAGGDPYPVTEMPAAAFLLLNRDGLDWNYRTTPQKEACFGMPRQRCAWPRGKALGGSSNLNFMAYARGNPRDYDNWANITGEPGWRYANVLKYFKRLEDYNYEGQWDDKMRKYHGKGGPVKIGVPDFTGLAKYFVQAGREMGYPVVDYNGEYEEGFSTFVYNQNKGRRMGTFQAYIQPYHDRRSFSVYKFAHVNRLIFDPSEKRVVGVEYVRHGQKKIAKATKEVILSAGSINTPKILMLSGIGPKEHLKSFGIRVKRDMPVGQNLQDHVSTFLGPFVINSTESFNLDRDITPDSFSDFLLDGKGPLTTTGVQATGFIASSWAKNRGERSWPDLQLVMLGTTAYKNYGRDSQQAFNGKPGFYQKFYDPKIMKGRESFQIINILNRPVTRGEVTLQSADPRVPPLMNPRYYESKEDIRRMVESQRMAVELVENSKAFKKINAVFLNHSLPGCERYKIKSDQYHECFARSVTLTIYHPTSSVPMGKPDDPKAILDGRLRVKGFKGLRVADASIMPVIVTSNPNAACIMIGEIAADFVKEDWLSLR